MAVESHTENSERTNPVKRIRWATQRVTGKKGVQKRKSIFARHSARRGVDEKKRESSSTETGLVKDESHEGESTESRPVGRTIYFNIPLPDSARDDVGRPLQTFNRNKIRTAKYTPISFVPKNLWFQFHNIANVYFLFIIILCVCMHDARAETMMLTRSVLRSSSPFSARRILG